jgi:hypothetical protein
LVNTFHTEKVSLLGENTAKLGKSVSTTLFGIFSKEPAVVIQGCATGLSMINVDDNNLEIIRKNP